MKEKLSIIGNSFLAISAIEGTQIFALKLISSFNFSGFISGCVNVGQLAIIAIAVYKFYKEIQEKKESKNG